MDGNRMTVEEALEALGIRCSVVRPDDGAEYRIRLDDVVAAFPGFEEPEAMKALLAELKSEGWTGFWSGRDGVTANLVVRG